MSIWYQPSAFGTLPRETQKIGFSAVPNTMGSPFTVPGDGSGPLSAAGLYGLIPNNKQSYGYDITSQKDADQFDPSSVSYMRGGGYSPNPLAGLQFTTC